MKRKLIALMLALALCLGLAPAWAAESDTAFADVAADAWYAPYVDYVARDGVMIGTGGGEFSPEEELTQAECLTLAYRLYDLLRGQENVVETAPEGWGSVTHWWTDICYTIEKRELTGIFDPADFNNRQAARSFFAKALYAAAGDKLEKINEVEAIPDLSRTMDGGSVTDLYREQVYALYEAGILNGVDDAGNFDADKSLTRAEAATMVARLLTPSLRIGASVETEPPAEQLNEYEIAQRLATPEEFHFNKGMPFLDMNPELRSALTYVEVVIDNTDLSPLRILRRYTAPGVEIITTQATDDALNNYLSRNRDNTELGTIEEIEAQVAAERGREWVYSVTYTVPGYSTMTGLQVGDTLERAEELGYTRYSGTDIIVGGGFAWGLRAQLKDGIVSQLYFSYGMGRMCGRYFDI